MQSHAEEELLVEEESPLDQCATLVLSLIRASGALLVQRVSTVEEEYKLEIVQLAIFVKLETERLLGSQSLILLTRYVLLVSTVLTALHLPDPVQRTP